VDAVGSAVNAAVDTVGNVISGIGCWINTRTELIKDILTGIAYVASATAIIVIVAGTGGIAGIGVATLVSVSTAASAGATAIECTDGGGLDAGGVFIFGAIVDWVFRQFERRLPRENPREVEEWRSRHRRMAMIEDASEQVGHIDRRSLPWAIPAFILGMVLLVASYLR